MAFLSDTDPDPIPRSTLCCDSTVEAYKHSDPEKKGKKERREILDRTRRSRFHVHNQYTTLIQAAKRIQYKFLLHPLLNAEPVLSLGDHQSLYNSALSNSRRSHQRWHTSTPFYLQKWSVALEIGEENTIVSEGKVRSSLREYGNEKGRLTKCNLKEVFVHGLLLMNAAYRICTVKMNVQKQPSTSCTNTITAKIYSWQ